jgi:hypothetical protein
MNHLICSNAMAVTKEPRLGKEEISAGCGRGKNEKSTLLQFLNQMKQRS